MKRGAWLRLYTGFGPDVNEGDTISCVLLVSGNCLFSDQRAKMQPGKKLGEKKIDDEKSLDKFSKKSLK